MKYIPPKDKLEEPLDGMAPIIMNWISIGYILIFTSIMLPLLIIRRNKRPLKQRSPVVILFHLLAFGFVMLTLNLRVVLLRGNGYLPCIFQVFHGAFGVPINMVPFILNAFRLFIIFTIYSKMYERLSANNDLEKNKKIVKWLTFFVSNKGILLAGFIMFIPHFLIFIFSLIFEPRSYRLDGCARFEYTVYLVGPQAIIYAIIWLIATILTIRVRDSHNISRENIIAGIITLFFAFIYVIMLIIQLANYTYIEYHVYDANFGWALMLCCQHILLYVIPTVQTFNWTALFKDKDWKTWWEGTSVIPEKFNRFNIKTIMKDPELRKRVLSFCKQEWSSENFYFLESCYQIPFLERKEKIAKIDYIIKMFVSLDGAMALNINASEIKSAKSRFDQVHNMSDAELDKFFAPIVEHIEHLMNDTLFRFTSTREFKDYVDKQSSTNEILVAIGLQ